MSTKRPTARTHRERTTQSDSSQFVRLGTQVPPAVKEHYVEAARRHKISLSLYFEMLSKVDPLAHGPLPEKTDQGSEKT